MKMKKLKTILIQSAFKMYTESPDKNKKEKLRHIFADLVREDLEKYGHDALIDLLKLGIDFGCKE